MRRRSWVLTIGSAAILGGLAWAGSSSAEDPAATTKVDERAKLRGQLASLRADVAVLQAEHGEAKVHLAEVMRRSERLEFIRLHHEQVRPHALFAYHVWAINGDEEGRKQLTQSLAPYHENEEKGAETAAALADVTRLYKDFRSALDQTRKRYRERSLELEEKSLELADFQRRYDQTQ